MFLLGLPLFIADCKQT